MTSDHACFDVPQPHFAQNRTGSDQNHPRERFRRDLLPAEEKGSNVSEKDPLLRNSASQSTQSEFSVGQNGKMTKPSDGFFVKMAKTQKAFLPPHTRLEMSSEMVNQPKPAFVKMAGSEDSFADMAELEGKNTENIAFLIENEQNMCLENSKSQSASCHFDKIAHCPSGHNAKMAISHSDMCQEVEADPSALSSIGSASNHRLRSTPLTPQTWQEAEKLAKLLCKSKLVPPGFESPDLCLIAILQGLEMGLPPMMALQRMALVEGKLTLWGDGALALVLRSGLCTSITEWMGLAGPIGDGQNKGNEHGDQSVLDRDLIFDPLAHKREDDWIAFCEVTRAGWDKPVRRSFSAQDAKRANLWKKEGPWLDYPKRMLQMRARAFALRDAFADVLGGLYMCEEIEPKGSKANASNTKDPTTRNSDQKNLGTRILDPKNTATRNSDSKIPDPEKIATGAIAATVISKTDAIIPDEKELSVKYRDINKPQKQHGLAACFKPQENPTRQPLISNQSLIWGQSKPVIAERRKAPAPPTEATNGSKVTNPVNVQKIHAKAQNGLKESEEPAKSYENAADAGKTDLILREFKRSLRNCLNLADLDACRLKFQPSLDLIAPESLDQAAQLYLEQEARIEAPLKPHAKLQSAKKCKPHPQIRRWKAQYRPYQHQNRQKQAHKTGFEQESASNDGPD